MMLKCIKSNVPYFTVGNCYDIEGEDFHGYTIYDEDTEEEVCSWYVCKSEMNLLGCTDRENAWFELVENSNVSDEYEEAEWQRLEKQLEQCKKTQDVPCNLALAYYLSQVQTYLRESGADVELVIRKDFLSLLDENCKEYQGNVEQIIRFIKASGELSKVAGEMSGEH